MGDINIWEYVVYLSTYLALRKVCFCHSGSVQIIYMNLSWCDHLRSFSMWCLEMPDCTAWRLYHSKAGGAFSNRGAKILLFSEPGYLL